MKPEHFLLLAAGSAIWFLLKLVALPVMKFFGVKRKRSKSALEYLNKRL